MRLNLKGFFCKKEKKGVLIVVGLGNPGEDYLNTYHNTGYNAVEALADKLCVKLKRAECSSLTGGAVRGGKRIIVAKPLTYMNLSGQAVKSLLVKYKAAPSDLVVIYDDADLPRFYIRARADGSGGTHNGMKSIIDILGTKDFKRIRIGVGREDGTLKDYVLSRVKKSDENGFKQCYAKAAEAVLAYAEHGDFDRLMRELNGGEGHEVQ